MDATTPGVIASWAGTGPHERPSMQVDGIVTRLVRPRGRSQARTHGRTGAQAHGRTAGGVRIADGS